MTLKLVQVDFHNVWDFVGMTDVFIAANEKMRMRKWSQTIKNTMIVMNIFEFYTEPGEISPPTSSLYAQLSLM